MILITGATGFIGKHFLVKATAKFGRENICILSSRVNPEFKSIVYSSLDLNHEIQDQIANLHPHAVFHLGAWTPKKASEANDTRSNSNILFTASLLQSLTNACRFIFASTLDVYAPTDAAINESTPSMPTSLYGRDKLECERLVEEWGRRTRSAFQILRIGHVYGPGEETYSKFLPITLSNVANHQPAEILGDGTDKRSFIHVSDVCDAILASEAIEQFSGPINIASARSVTLEEVIKILATQLGRQIPILWKDRTSPKRDYMFDSSRMMKLLKPESIEFEDGLMEEFHYVANSLQPHR